jgi:hypothetical protein
VPAAVRIEGVPAVRVRLDEEGAAAGGLELAAGEIATFRLG